VIVPTDIVPQITAIHASPTRLVLVFAGAGSLGLAWLHAIAGSSRTILEAVDAYAPRSLAEITGHLEASAVSAATAQAMAIWAYRRAQTLSEGNWPLLGVGLTAALRTDRPRRGADHAFLAIQSATACNVEHLVLNQQSRLEQEIAVSRWLIAAIERAGGPAPRCRSRDKKFTTQISPLPQRGRGVGGEGRPHLSPSPLPLPPSERKGEA